MCNDTPIYLVVFKQGEAVVDLKLLLFEVRIYDNLFIKI